MSYASRSVRWVSAAALISLLAACGVDSPHDEGERTISAPPGRRAKVPFKTSNGGVVERDVEVDKEGHVWIGDMGFGSIQDPKPRGNAIIDLDSRWPNGVVRYVFKSSDGGVTDVPAVVRQRVRDAMAYIKTRIPRLTFQEYADGQVPPAPYVFIRAFEPDEDDGNERSRSDVGVQPWDAGSGVPFPYYNGQLTEIGLEAEERTIVHELGHMLGMRHEHSRSDRDSYVKICINNVVDDATGNFDIESDIEALSPYDYTSNMHYRVSTFQKPPPEPWFPPLPLGCDGHVLEALADTMPDEPGVQTRTSNPDYSAQDINTLSLMYGLSLGFPTTNELVGQAVAAGDFDGDGYHDLAIGAPGHAGPGGSATGRIYVMKGTEKGLTPWITLDQGGLGEQAGDMLGMTLASGDFDGDGIDDLAAGIPKKSDVGGHKGGAVLLYHGGRFHGSRLVTDCATQPCIGTVHAPLTLWKLFRADSILGETAQNGDQFGAAIVAGDLDDDGIDELVIGAPGRASNDGRVFVFRGGTFVGGILSAASFGRAEPSATRFGSALAIGDFDNDQIVDLGVGAPAGAQGRVYAFEGRTTNFVPAPLTRFDGSSSLGPNANFGAALAAGRVRGAANHDLVVGAPFEVNGAGFAAGGVHVLSLMPSGVTTTPAFTQTRVFVSPTNEAEHLGTALALFDFEFDGHLEIAAGAPSKQAGRGRVAVLKDAGGTLTQMAEALPSTSLSSTFGFGTSLAVGSFKHPTWIEKYSLTRTMRLVVGAPQADMMVPAIDNVGAAYGYSFTAASATSRMTFFTSSRSDWAN